MPGEAREGILVPEVRDDCRPGRDATRGDSRYVSRLHGAGRNNPEIIWETTGQCLVEWDDGDEDFRGRGWRSFTKRRRSALRRQAGHGETMRRGAASRLRRQYILLHALYHQQPAVQVSEMNSGTVYFSG